VYDDFFFLGRFSALMLPLSIAGSLYCRWCGRGDAGCVASGTSWGCELPTTSYEWNKVMNFVRCWNKWQFRQVVTIFVLAKSKTWLCLGMHPRRCRRRSPPWTRREFVEGHFHSGLHPMNDLRQEPVVEWDDPQRRLWCSCSKMLVVKHSYRSSTQT
jgi:hypothetical protein